VTHLRQAMLDELQRRNYAKTTIRYYIQAVERFAKHFHRPPDQLNQTHLREYQAYLLRDRKLEPRTVKLHVSALRFFFVKTLKRRYLLDDIPYPKVPRRLPTILTVEEVTRLIDAARTLTDRTMLMVLYSTGMRNAELRSLQVKNIDSRSMSFTSSAARAVAIGTSPQRTRICCVAAHPLSHRLGRLRQAPVRRPQSRAALSRALHPPRRDLQPSARRRDRGPGDVSVEGLPPRESGPTDDAQR
jgi:site-specific recombinase XerD